MRGWDPVAIDGPGLLPGVGLYDDLLDARHGADAAVIVTEWDEVRDFPTARCARSCAAPARRRSQPPRTRASARRLRLRLRVDRRARQPSSAVDGGDPSRRRQGRAPRRRRAGAAEGRSSHRGSGRSRRLPGGRLVAWASGASSSAAAAGVRPLFRRARRPRRRDRPGGGARAARPRRRSPLRGSAPARGGPVLALNGDELFDVDFGPCSHAHGETGAAATITVAPLARPSGSSSSRRRGTRLPRGAGRSPTGSTAGVYVLGEEALERLPERGDHERTTFPELAAEGGCGRLPPRGVWLTVNTPKDLRQAEE